MVRRAGCKYYEMGTWYAIRDFEFGAVVIGRCPSVLIRVYLRPPCPEVHFVFCDQVPGWLEFYAVPAFSLPRQYFHRIQRALLDGV